MAYKKLFNPKKIFNIDYLLVFLLIFTASTANVLLKRGSEVEMSLQDIRSIITNYQIIAGYILYLLPTLITILLYRKYKVNVVQSLASGVYIATPILAQITNTEDLNLLKILGIGIMSCSIIYIINNQTDEAD